MSAEHDIMSCNNGKDGASLPRSGKCLPGREDVDSGVDDLQHPKYYVIWNMNINTHIYPEFVVSFKSSNARGITASSQGLQGHLRVFASASASNESINHQTSDSGRSQEKPSLGSNTSQTTKSPWMPFRMLFDAISNKIPRIEMDRVTDHYELFRTPSRHELEVTKRNIKGPGGF